MTKLTPMEMVTLWKHQLPRLISDIKEQLTWADVEGFTPLYSREEKFEILVLAEDTFDLEF